MSTPDQRSTRHRIIRLTNNGGGDGYQAQSRLLSLPKELRLAIYEYVLADAELCEVSEHVKSSVVVTTLSTQQGWLRACSLLRREALPLYYKATTFLLDITSKDGEQTVFDWIRRCSESCLLAFNNMQYVFILTEPRDRGQPNTYVLDVQQSKLVAVKRHMTIRRFQVFRRQLESGAATRPWLGEKAVHMQDGSPWAEVETWLQRLPASKSPKFDVAKTLRVVIEILVKHQ